MIGIVTVNWNGYTVTVQLVSQFLGNAVQDFRLVVVNNSPDEAGLFDRNPLFEDPRIELIHSSENVGYAGGLNLGLQRLLGVEAITHFLLLNNDVVIEPEFIKNLLVRAKDADRIYSPLILLRDSGRVQNSGGKIAVWVGGTLNLNKNVPLDRVRRVSPDFLSGCVLFMHRSVIERVGFFDPAYGSYYEDVDFCLRARRLGIGIEVLWDVTIRHFHSYSTATRSEFKTYLLNRNQILFARKHLAVPARILFLPAALVRGAAQAVLNRQIRPFFRGVVAGLST